MTSTTPALTAEEIAEIREHLKHPVSEWPEYDDNNPSLSWSIEDHTVLLLLDTLEHERGVVRAAAVIAARLEAGLIVDFDNLLDALEQAGYTQERCAEIWAESQP